MVFVNSVFNGLFQWPRLKGGIYHKIQIDLTYNSNHIEGQDFPMTRRVSFLKQTLLVLQMMQ